MNDRPSISAVTKAVDEHERLAAGTHTLRKQKGRRRADAVLAVMRAMADDDRDMHDLDSDAADCIWAIAGLLHRCAGQPEQANDARPTDSPKAVGAAVSKQTLDPNVEAGIVAVAQAPKATVDAGGGE